MKPEELHDIAAKFDSTRPRCVCGRHYDRTDSFSHTCGETMELRARNAALEADREAFGMRVARAVYLIYATTDHSAPAVSNQHADDEHLRLLSIVAEVAAVKAASGE